MVEMHVVGISLNEDQSAPEALLQPTGSRRVLALPLSGQEALALGLALDARFSRACAGRGAKSPGADADTHEPDSYAPLRDAPLFGPGSRVLHLDILRRVEGEFLAQAAVALASDTVSIDCRAAEGLILAVTGRAPVRVAPLLLDLARDMDALLADMPAPRRKVFTSVMSARARQTSGGKTRRRAAVGAAMADGSVLFADVLSAIKGLPLRALAGAGSQGGPEADETPGARGGGTLPDGQQGRSEDTLQDRLIDISEFPGRAPKAQAVQGKVVVVQAGQTVQLGGAKPQRVRISLVRQGKGEAQVLDEISLPLVPPGSEAPDQAAQAAQAGQPEQPGQSAQAGQPGQPEQIAQPGQPGQAGQGAPPSSPQKTPGVERTKVATQPGLPDQPDQSNQPGRPNQTDQTGKAGQRGRADQPAREVQSNQPDQQGQAGQQAQAGRPGQADQQDASPAADSDKSSEDERWAALLRTLSPVTKVPM